MPVVKRKAADVVLFPIKFLAVLSGAKISASKPIVLCKSGRRKGFSTPFLEMVLLKISSIGLSASCTFTNVPAPLNDKLSLVKALSPSKATTPSSSDTGPARGVRKPAILICTGDAAVLTLARPLNTVRFFNFSKSLRYPITIVHPPKRFELPV